MIALITDVHAGEKSFNKSIFNLQMDFFREQFFPFVLKHGIKHVLHLGDFVHNRSIIDLLILGRVKKEFFAWFDENDVILHTIIGNHDTYFKNSIHPNFFSENVKEFNNIRVYTEPSRIVVDDVKIGMIPWILKGEELLIPGDVEVVCGHFDIINFPMHSSGMKSSEGFEKSEFKNYELVLSGHYHTKSNDGNIRYLGTPYQLSWSDFGIDKGFWVLQDKEIKFVPNDKSPRFLKIFYREVGGIEELRISGLKKDKSKKCTREETLKIVKNNFVKLIVEKITDHKQFDDFYSALSESSKDDYKIEIIDTEELICIDDENISNEEFEAGNILKSIMQYIDVMKFPDNISKKILLDICSKLYMQAEESKVDIQTSC